jgi:penicillin-binding protein 1A
MLMILLSLGMLGVIFLAGAIFVISMDLPSIDNLKNYNPSVPSKILSSDGTILLEVGKEKREIVEYEKIPKRIINSFLAAEDDNFFKHSGIDYKGILRATLKNIQAGRVVQGASTITQQVAKSVLLTSERTFSRKIKDLLLARKIEQQFSKEEILFVYLNQVYLGGGYYGIKRAFKGYFNKQLDEASIAESALVAGLLVAPGKYSPYVNPQYAKKRQRYVLSRLLKTKKITKEEYDVAINESIKMYYRKANPMKGGYFTDWIRRQVIDRFGKEEFLTGGLTIHTTMNWRLQQLAQKQIKKGVEQIDKRQGYKGVLGKVENIQEFLLEQRKENLKKQSAYFTFNSAGENIDEFFEHSDDYSQILNYEEEQKELVQNWYKKFLVPGNYDLDRFNQNIDKNKLYEAVVVKVSNLEQLVYVKFNGGLTGVIPYEYFRWAHKRQIEEKRTYWSYIKRPSKILKKKDKILVRVRAVPRGIWNYLSKNFKEEVKDEQLLSALKKQKYYILSLEQDVDVQAALVSIIPQSGKVISMVGGSSFEKSQFNRAIQSNRQPGSSFKPIIYAAGLENGFTPASMLLDTPSALGSSDASLAWKPQNYDGKFKGKMTLRRSLEVSRNIPTIKLVQDVGVDKITNFVERLKIKAKLPADLSISLGSFGMNLLEVVRMYGIFPNRGKYIKLTSITSVINSLGEEIWKKEEGEQETLPQVQVDKEQEDIKDESLGDEEKVVDKWEQFKESLSDDQVYDPRLAYLMNNIMRGVIQNGTGRAAANISQNIGGKTGTTNNYVDAWFIGYGKNVVTGVWTGFDNNQTMGFGETGAKAALPIWKGFMKEALREYGDHDFSLPNGITNVYINKKTGDLAKAGQPNSLLESFVSGFEPSEAASGGELESNDVEDEDDYYLNQ